MTFADDDRARVPFALLGVLLLVGSATFAATTSLPGPTRESHAADHAMDAATGNAATALRSAVSAAGRRAALSPVTEPADSSVGRVLNDSEPFRDQLRLSVYTLARRNFGDVTARRGDVVARPSLPPTPNASALRRAKVQVSVAGVDDGRALRVTVRNLTVTAERNGRRVVRDRTTVTVTVRTPVLAAHRRVSDYENALSRDALDGDGLDRRLTARLHAVAWGRGYAQYGGLPVSNVLANRHVELSTNGALLRLQRSAVGGADPGGWRALRRATARTGVRDLLALGPSGSPPPPVLLADGDPAGPVPPLATGDRPRRTDVTVGALATDALAEFVDGGAERSLDDVLRTTHRATLGLHAASTVVDREPRPDPAPPGSSWELAAERTTRSVTVSDGGGRAPTPSVGEARSVGTVARTVVVRHSVERTWRDGNDSRTRTRSWTVRHRVGVSAALSLPPVDGLPSRSVEPLLERGGALDGPNLAPTVERARHRLNASADDLARRAALDDRATASRTVTVDRASNLSRWIASDLDALAARVASLRVEVPAVAAATGTVNPPARLRRLLGARRAELLDAPATYRGVADRSRVAARAAYLDAVSRELERRARRADGRQDRFDRALASAGGGGSDSLVRLASLRGGDETRRSGRFRTSAHPAYLTLAAVDSRHAPARAEGRRVHPLSARNVNLFTVPYGDAADTVASGAVGGDVRLGTAARTLLAANRTDRPVTDRHRALGGAVRDSMRSVRAALRDRLRARTTLNATARRAAVAAGVRRWGALPRRALAASNGSLAVAVEREARTRGADAPLLAERLRHSLRQVRNGSARVPQERVAPVSARAREAVAAGLSDAGEEGVDRARERWLDDAVRAVPAGLPVAPAPGFWYATVNVWHVRVRGGYASFAVVAPDGSAATPLRYVRDGGAATLDVDGDRAPERLGRSERLTFDVSTAVTVVVPAGPRGVGDVDGNADERSAGWGESGRW